MTSQFSFLAGVVFCWSQPPIYPHQVSEAAHQFISLTYLLQKEEKWFAKPHQLGRGSVDKSNPVSETYKPPCLKENHLDASTAYREPGIALRSKRRCGYVQSCMLTPPLLCFSKAETTPTEPLWGHQPVSVPINLSLPAFSKDPSLQAGDGQSYSICKTKVLCKGRAPYYPGSRLVETS